jgi:acetyl esterase
LVNTGFQHKEGPMSVLKRIYHRFWIVFGKLLIKGLELYGRAFVFNSCLPAVGEAHYDLNYAGTRKKAQCLDVYVPPARRRKKPVPVLVNLHGGGLMCMDKRSYERFSRTLARAGFLVVNANYRLAPGAKIEQQMEDAAAAVNWAYENAGRFGGDPSRLVLAGDSAGAFLAAWYAQAAADPGLLLGLNASTVHAGNLKAMLLIYGVFDWEEALGACRPLRPAVRMMVRAAFGNDPARQQEMSRRLSITRNLEPGFPPSMIVSGRTDPIHFVSRTFARACEEKGVPHRDLFLPWYLFPEATHAFMIVWFYPSALYTMFRAKRWLRKTVK